jgi:hypothetical protein
MWKIQVLSKLKIFLWPLAKRQRTYCIIITWQRRRDAPCVVLLIHGSTLYYTAQCREVFELWRMMSLWNIFLSHQNRMKNIGYFLLLRHYHMRVSQEYWCRCAPSGWRVEKPFMSNFSKPPFDEPFFIKSYMADWSRLRNPRNNLYLRTRRDDHWGRRDLAMNLSLGLILAWLVRAVERSFGKRLSIKVKEKNKRITMLSLVSLKIV